MSWLYIFICFLSLNTNVINEKKKIQEKEAQLIEPGVSLIQINTLTNLYKLTNFIQFQEYLNYLWSLQKYTLYTFLQSAFYSLDEFHENSHSTTSVMLKLSKY